MAGPLPTGLTHTDPLPPIKSPTLLGPYLQSQPGPESSILYISVVVCCHDIVDIYLVGQGLKRGSDMAWNDLTTEAQTFVRDNM